ncbi:MAG TPA: AzlC family ABC transporter permease, partial [Jiangellaceae bacterium]|nr:AzlC family ABC transporter permease [Jiangellaceae bacterium]
MSHDLAVLQIHHLRQQDLTEEANQERWVAEARQAGRPGRRRRNAIASLVARIRAAEHIAVEATRDMLPVAASIVPFALIIGVAIQKTGIDELLGVVSGAVLFAGSAQLSALSLLEAGAGLAVVVGAVALVNARFLVYGAGLEARFRNQPTWFRWLGPQFIVDQTYALAINRTDLDTARRFRHYWLAMAAVLGVIFVASTAAGVLLGPVLPAASPLEFVAPAVFIGLLAPRLRGPRSVIVAVVAALVSLFGADLPNGLGLAAGVGAGFAIAAL